MFYRSWARTLGRLALAVLVVALGACAKVNDTALGLVSTKVPAYAIIIREHFNPKEAGARVGSVIMATLLGMALGGWMSGWVFDLTGSYHAAFLNGIAWNFLNLCIASWLFWRVRQAEQGASVRA